MKLTILSTAAALALLPTALDLGRAKGLEFDVAEGSVLRKTFGETTRWAIQEFEQLVNNVETPTDLEEMSCEVEVKLEVLDEYGETAGGRPVALERSVAVARAEAETERAQAYAAESNQLTIDQFVEQSRQAWLAGEPERAFAYLAGAKKRGADSPALRFLLARASHRLEDRLLVLPAHRDVVTAARFSPDGTRIATASVDKSAERCTQLGGRVRVEPKSMGSYGRYCVIEDPAGAVCALFEPAG